MSEEIKDCPFCGAEGVSDAIAEQSINRTSYQAMCSNGDCHIMPTTFGYDVEQEAIDAWNARCDG
jgi:transcription elongation factor Elf1